MRLGDAAGVVHRPRLTNRLVAGDHPALTLVSAPAGFGKTTLLADWFADLHALARDVDRMRSRMTTEN